MYWRSQFIEKCVAFRDVFKIVFRSLLYIALYKLLFSSWSLDHSGFQCNFRYIGLGCLCLIFSRYSVFNVQRSNRFPMQTTRRGFIGLRPISSRQSPYIWKYADLIFRTSTRPNQHISICTSRCLRGDGEIRTHDPLLARQVLSQLSYTPMNPGLHLLSHFVSKAVPSAA